MPGAVEALIEREVAGRFSSFERVVTVTTTATQLMRANPERVGWLLTNTGAQVVNIGFAVSTPSPETLPLQADGGGASVNVRDDFVLPTFPVFGVVGVGSSTVHVVEIVRESA